MVSIVLSIGHRDTSIMLAEVASGSLGFISCLLGGSMVTVLGIDSS